MLYMNNTPRAQYSGSCAPWSCAMGGSLPLCFLSIIRTWEMVNFTEFGKTFFKISFPLYIYFLILNLGIESQETWVSLYSKNNPSANSMGIKKKPRIITTSVSFYRNQIMELYFFNPLRRWSDISRHIENLFQPLYKVSKGETS